MLKQLNTYLNSIYPTLMSSQWHPVLYSVLFQLDTIFLFVEIK